MDELSHLSKLGRAAGVPGIALGSATAVLGAVLGLTNVITEGWRGPLLLVIVLGVVGFVVIALFGWIRSSRVGDQLARTEGADSPSRNEDFGKSGGRQEATTRGVNSSATNIRR